MQFCKHASAILSVLEESLKTGQRGVAVQELEGLLRDEQMRQKSTNLTKLLLVPSSLNSEFFPVSPAKQKGANSMEASRIYLVNKI